MVIDQKVLLSIKSTSQLILPGSQVILFGSRANGTASANSDYDLLFVTQEDFDISTKMSLKSQIRKILASMKIDADLFIESAQEVNIKKNLKGHVIRQALFEGIKL